MAENTTTSIPATTIPAPNPASTSATAPVPVPAAAPAPVPAAPVFPGGYNGKILRVNLSTGSFSSEPITEQFCRKYLGGAGFIAYFLWKELKPGIDALSPANKLIFALGPISGLLLPGTARNSIGAKSPMTGGIAKSECGGYWAAELKRAGFDAIIVEGKADKPVYLWVHDGEVNIRDAANIWGKNTKETEETVRAELGDTHIHLAMIGPGGENMVRYACIMEGCKDAGGRGGLGAVMGSKNLKAIAVRGHNLPPVANPDKVKEIRQRMVAIKHPLSNFGTGGPDMLFHESSGNLPVRNFKRGLFPEVNQIHGGIIKDTCRVGMEGCFACPVRCKKVVKVDEPFIVDPEYGGPEYETLAAFGPNCGVTDLKSILKGNERCNAYSLDTISCGSTIAFAMECFEKGYLTINDTEGLDLRFGNAEAMLKAIDLIAERKGFGNVLAEGSARLAHKIGQDSINFAIQVKGLESPMHDPRMKTNMAYGYMFSPIGADHCEQATDGAISTEKGLGVYHSLGWHLPFALNEISPRKVGFYKVDMCNYFVIDSLVTCLFVGYGPEGEAELVKAVTGWDTGVAEMERIGERVLTTMRLFNVREGFTAADDVLPERFFEPKTDGVLANMHMDRAKIDQSRKYFYALMGWDADGVPLPEKVEELYIE
jgi:aldehyde:ferredoxin oxidoreductase